ncbi:MAG: amidase family protein, partial [Pseudomonadota bacterium]
MQPDSHWPTLNDLATQLRAGETSAEALAQASLSTIAETDSAENPVFLHLFAEQALAEARAIDRAREAGEPLSDWAGIPFAVKDLFDVKGHVTHAGARVTASDPAAAV